MGTDMNMDKAICEVGELVKKEFNPLASKVIRIIAVSPARLCISFDPFEWAGWKNAINFNFRAWKVEVLHIYGGKGVCMVTYLNLLIDYSLGQKLDMDLK